VRPVDAESLRRMRNAVADPHNSGVARVAAPAGRLTVLIAMQSLHAWQASRFAVLTRASNSAFG